MAYRFETVDGGTRVTESYDVSWLPAWARIVDGPLNRRGELHRHMRHTLEQLKREAEATGSPSISHHSAVRVAPKGGAAMITTYRAAPDIDVITSAIPIPGMGLIPVNAFVLHGPEPILVDTGTVIERDEFMTVLRSVIDPAALKWIWLTHTDFDHIGSLATLLEENARVAGRDLLPRGRHHGAVCPAADGPGLPHQPRPDN